MKTFDPRRTPWASVRMAALLAATFAGNVANAGVFYSLDTVINPSAPDSSPPWLTALFEDNGSNHVKLTLTSSLEISSEFVGSLAFNFVAPGSGTLAITQTSSTAINTEPVYTIVANGVDLNGAGAAGMGFDVGFQFETSNSNPAARFAGSDVAVFDLMFPGLTENAFKDVNQLVQHLPHGVTALVPGLYYIAAHIQGIPASPSSGSIGDIDFEIKPHIDSAVPEPGSLVVWGLLGMAGILYRRRRNVG